MHSLYVFDFLRTVSLQLKASLEAIRESALTEEALEELRLFQTAHDSLQGVYVIHYAERPVYVGKANNVSERLGQHLLKLRGRKGIDARNIGYKALLLDKSMSTAANEDILISMFREENGEMWNGAGFGPKDPGKERDTTRPGKFDRTYPIEDAYEITLPVAEGGAISLRDLFSRMKAQLPYVFRYNVPAEELDRELILSRAPFSARNLLQSAVTALGEGWKGAIISYGMVLYKTTKHYPHGEEILPSGSALPPPSP